MKNVKNLMALSGLLVILSACGGGPGTGTVTVKMDNADGATVYFNKFLNNNPITLDSAVLKGGKAQLNIPALPLDFYQIAVKDQGNCIIAIDSTDRLMVHLRAENIGLPDEISGSQHTEKLHEMYRMIADREGRIDSLKQVIQAGQSSAEVVQQYNDLTQSYYQECIAFVKANKGSPAVLPALNKLNMQQEFELFKETSAALGSSMGRSPFYLSFKDQVARAEQQVQAMKLQQEQMAKMDAMLKEGATAPDIIQQTPEGKTLRLSDLRGKYVLIDFWASWCKPCRVENPNVLKVYNKYKSKGFEILGVSLDKTKDRWVQAIQQDKLPWKHVSDLKAWSNEAAQTYGVNSIPFTVLVDPEGKIISKGLRGQQLEQKLAELLGA